MRANSYPTPLFLLEIIQLLKFIFLRLILVWGLFVFGRGNEVGVSFQNSVPWRNPDEFTIYNYLQTGLAKKILLRNNRAPTSPGGSETPGLGKIGERTKNEAVMHGRRGINNQQTTKHWELSDLGPMNIKANNFAGFCLYEYLGNQEQIQVWWNGFLCTTQAMSE